MTCARTSNATSQKRAGFKAGFGTDANQSLHARSRSFLQSYFGLGVILCTSVQPSKPRLAHDANYLDHIDRRIRQPLRSRDTCGFFRHSLAIWRQVVWPRRPANPQRMPGASIASISLYVCHPRPVNVYPADKGTERRPGEHGLRAAPPRLFKEITGKFSDAVETRLAHVIRRTQ